ncbi:hypothetical protein [Streptomyces sp. NPDC002537]
MGKARYGPWRAVRRRRLTAVVTAAAGAVTLCLPTLTHYRFA